ncbi:MAG: hypothetical protein LIO93_05920 [Bacteroidales bacterium]|nr:hypothetical protein [Bacteroidales bacterium]
MTNFSYKIEHDFGLAPNPFWGYCTLAVCKGDIRKNKNCVVGSWIFGSGSKELKNINKLIYAMQVEEILTFDEYWNDLRFQKKKPIINGSLPQMYGDNFYHHNEDGIFIQENSAHSKANGLPNGGHITKDKRGGRVLISRKFYYFGENAIDIPEELIDDIFCTKGSGRYVRSKSLSQLSVNKLTEYLQKNYTVGRHGLPKNWIVYTKDTKNFK